ncbi:15157_t:CDS:2 [Gigaspora margarita]|uniref:15157_t:CDS:1 n=1 Tax=Gigaspora margarita TaxID=4874 RepID=A0ABN7V988_GIGMA|nr:15157_t:CDS:2 [Gigaspora margarita]
MSTTDVSILMANDAPNTPNNQSAGFIILEIIINTVMIAEVVTRFVALGKGDCSHKGEEIVDLILIIVRNIMQFGRLIMMLRKNGKNRKARNATIDFSNIRESNPSMDFDSISNNAFLITDDDDDI